MATLHKVSTVVIKLLSLENKSGPSRCCECHCVPDRAGGQAQAREEGCLRWSSGVYTHTLYDQGMVITINVANKVLLVVL